MRFVPIESAGHQGGLMLHRARDLLVRQRTQHLNAVPSHLAELGLVAAVALANNLARIAWAVLARGETYRAPVPAATVETGLAMKK